MPGIPTRKDDETLLEWIGLRQQGWTSQEIADAYGVTSSRVRVATHRVKETDMAESRENVAEAYW